MKDVYAQLTVRRNADGTITVTYADGNGAETHVRYPPSGRNDAMAETLERLGQVFAQ